MSVLHLREATKVYGAGHTAVRAVDGVSLHVERGEVVLIMGPSGSGKTTLLLLAGGLLRPTSGSVRLGQDELSALPEADRSRLRLRRVGFIFQAFNLLSALTARENVEAVLNLAGINGGQARRRAEEMLGDLGLRDRFDSLPKNLSGGEKQRVAIVRALANEPDLVFADEPTANLDSRTGYQVMHLLRRIAKEHGKSVVIVSHDRRIEDIADRILWMEDGRLREAGPQEESITVRDPVCGMTIERGKATDSVEYEGVLYHLCSEECGQQFRADPRRYATGITVERAAGGSAIPTASR